VPKDAKPIYRLSRLEARQTIALVVGEPDLIGLTDPLLVNAPEPEPAVKSSYNVDFDDKPHGEETTSTVEAVVPPTYAPTIVPPMSSNAVMQRVQRLLRREQ